MAKLKSRKGCLGGLAALFVGAVVLVLIGPRLLNYPLWMTAWNKHQGTKPILFYGQVVDGGGSPIQGADVELRVTLSNWPRVFWAGGIMRSDTVHVTTDDAGRFSYQHNRSNGISLQVWKIKRQGFEWRQPTESHGLPVSPTFCFSDDACLGHAQSRHVADFNNPVVFQMKKAPK